MPTPVTPTELRSLWVRPRRRKATSKGIPRCARNDNAQHFFSTLLGGGGAVHEAEQEFGAAFEVGRAAVVVVEARLGNHRGQLRGLFRGKSRGGGPKIVLSSGFCAVHSISPLDDVQIDLENAALGQQAFHHHGDERLLGLAPIGALPGEEEVLGQLLADGRAAAQPVGLGEVALVGVFDRLPIETVVVEEPLVFGSDHGAFEVDGNVSIRDPIVPELSPGILALKPGESQVHKRCRGWVVVPQPPDSRCHPKVPPHKHEQKRNCKASQPALEQAASADFLQG